MTLTAPLLVVTTTDEPCCCCLGPSTPARELHCPACHSGSGHRGGWLLLVLGPDGMRLYREEDQEQADIYAAARGAVVTALPILADYRPAPAPVVGHAPVPEQSQEPEEPADGWRLGDRHDIADQWEGAR